MLRHEYINPGKFQFESGDSIEDLRIVYHTSEKEWHKGDDRKVVWVIHALTANSDAEDWWGDIVGKGKLIDIDKYFVVCVNMLGSPYGTTAPASICPDTGEPYYLDFPHYTIRDMLSVFIIIRKHLGIDNIDLLVGSSIGGFQGVEWLVTEPDVIRHAVIIATSAVTSPWLAAQNENMLMALEADPSFRACQDLKGGEMGLRAARAIGMSHYRYFKGYNLAQPEPDTDFVFASRAPSYQRYQGKKFSDRFDSYSYYYIVKSTDSQNVGRNRGGVEKALSTVKADCTFVAIDSDGVFPPPDVKLMADIVPNSKYHLISSDWGHDGFLLEFRKLSQIIEPILQDIVEN